MRTSTPGPIAGVELVRLGSDKGTNGDISFVDFEKLPFRPRRMFEIHNVSEGGARGNHAHKSCSQLIIASAGSCCVVLDDLTSLEEIVVSSRDEALLIPPGVWIVLKDFVPGTILTILASEPFDRGEYIETKEELAAFSAMRTFRHSMSVVERSHDQAALQGESY